MSCITGNCTILDGATTNGTLHVSGYNPNAPVPHWHQNMELATICIANSLTFCIIVARIWYRWVKLKRFRSDDRWMAAAGFFMIGYTVSQIGTNVYGSGLHIYNIPKSWLPWHWHYLAGWAGYYSVMSCIKVSVCCYFIEILPIHLRALRYGAYSLCTFIIMLGITLTTAWLFDCTPFLSNFVWSIDSTSCVNFDIFRWLWVGLSIPIDLLLCLIPLRMLNRTQLRQHERRILKMVFCATLLGTITCTIGLYGIWENRTANAYDMFYDETVFVMLNDIEIFMYTLGASFPVLSRYLVSVSTPTPHARHNNFSSWARSAPNFFLSNHSLQGMPPGQGIHEDDDRPAAPIRKLNGLRSFVDGIGLRDLKSVVGGEKVGNGNVTVDERELDGEDGRRKGLGESGESDRDADLESGLSVGLDISRIQHGGHRQSGSRPLSEEPSSDEDSVLRKYMSSTEVV